MGLKKIFTSGCGCRTKNPDVFQPKRNPNPEEGRRRRSSSSAAAKDDATAATVTKIKDSVAVVKESDDPYRDFQQSLAEMIVEKEIYDEDGLRELLRRFLELNPRHHHGVIVRAFEDICLFERSEGSKGSVLSSSRDGSSSFVSSNRNGD